MPRKLDPAISAVLQKYGFGPDACWDSHGAWVVYHRVLEQIAVKASITFDPPQIIEGNGLTRSVAICVTGRMGEAHCWSIGEASEHNYRVSGKQAAYPYAMAEKRAKDRVILKLIGLHGIAYSEDEADDFKDSRPAPQAAAEPPPEPSPMSAKAREYARDIQGCANVSELDAWAESTRSEMDKLSADEVETLRKAWTARKAAITTTERQAA